MFIRSAIVMNRSELVNNASRIRLGRQPFEPHWLCASVSNRFSYAMHTFMARTENVRGLLLAR